jgi:hypothetical protein
MVAAKIAHCRDRNMLTGLPRLSSILSGSFCSIIVNISCFSCNQAYMGVPNTNLIFYILLFVPAVSGLLGVPCLDINMFQLYLGLFGVPCFDPNMSQL